MPPVGCSKAGRRSAAIQVENAGVACPCETAWEQRRLRTRPASSFHRFDDGSWREVVEVAGGGAIIETIGAAGFTVQRRSERGRGGERNVFHQAIRRSAPTTRAAAAIANSVVAGIWATSFSVWLFIRHAAFAASAPRPRLLALVAAIPLVEGVWRRLQGG